VALRHRQSPRVHSDVVHGGGGGVSREQLVGPVVYGQHVPEEPPVPPADLADTPDTAAASGDAAVPTPDDPAGLPFTNEADSGKFLVRLDNFTGPFDLLLQLIGKHKLDVTEVALHQVTDDFIAYIRAMGDDWDLGEASEFLLVAATLLDLKAARLLPAAEVEDEEDLALLEARDLLFARLLQYKAFKEAAAYIADLEGTGAKRWPRAVSMEPRYAEALPDLVLGVGVERLFKLALKQFTPKPGPPQVSIAHIHQVRVSVREHAALLRDRLRRAGSATFSMLVADCESTLEVVARFLALLELYREGLIDFEQPVSLDELTVRWIGGDAPDAELDIDDYEGSKPDPSAASGDDGPDELASGDDGSDELSASDGDGPDELLALGGGERDELSAVGGDEPLALGGGERDELLPLGGDEPLASGGDGRDELSAVGGDGPDEPLVSGDDRPGELASGGGERDELSVSGDDGPDEPSASSGVGSDELLAVGGGEPDDGDSADAGLGKSGVGGFDSAGETGDLGGDENGAEESAVEERS